MMMVPGLWLPGKLTVVRPIAEKPPSSRVRKLPTPTPVLAGAGGVVVRKATRVTGRGAAPPAKRSSRTCACEIVAAAKDPTRMVQASRRDHMRDHMRDLTRFGSMDLYARRH